MSAERLNEAHRSAVVCALLGVVGTVIGLAGFWSISGPPLRAVQGVGLVVNGGALAVLSRRRRPSLARSHALFLLVLVPTVVMTWLIDDARAAAGGHWVPYEPVKLSALTLAMIAPPAWWVGLAAIAAFLGSAFVHQLVLDDAVRARMAAGEPLGIIAYGAFALVLLGFKQRSHAMQSELDLARSEKMALERVARVAMALRDLANTPIQTLELVRQALRGAGPEQQAQAARMGRALERLHRLNDILAPYQAGVTVDDAGHAFEAEAVAAKDRPPPPKTGACPGGAAPSRARRAPRRPA